MFKRKKKEFSTGEASPALVFPYLLSRSMNRDSVKVYCLNVHMKVDGNSRSSSRRTS